MVKRASRSAIRVGLILAGCGLLAATAASADSGSVTRTKLENGLRVILRPIKKAPQVAVVVVYDIGSDHDPPGRSGLAHLTEHLYITGATPVTPARTADDFFRHYSGQCNAQTGDRYTVFAGVVNRDGLQQELMDAAARMGELQVDTTALERERGRLAAEVANMFGGMPRLAAQNLAREVLRPTPAGGRRGGRPEALRTLGAKELGERLGQYYRPGNAILVVAGGFDVEEVRTIIAREFGPIPRGEALPKPAERKLNRPATTQSVEVDAVDGSTESVACLAFAAPAPASEAYPAFLMLMSAVLNEFGMGGMLSLGAQAVYAPIDDPNVVCIVVPLKEGASTEKVIRGVRRRLKKACDGAASLPNSKAAREVFGMIWGIGAPSLIGMRGNPYGLAFSLARREQLGVDAKTLDRALDEVTPEQMNAVAREVFGPDREVDVVVRPKRPHSP